MIELKAVTKSYGSAAGGRTVLGGVDARIKTGEFVAVFGKSGSGKSTLLHLIGGLDRDYGGSIQVEGHTLESLSDSNLSRLRGKHIGFVFQTPTFLSHLDCMGNLIFAARFADGNDTPERLKELLGSFGLSEFGRAKPDELSGGQRQRLAMVRALVGDPSVLLLDEPTGNLDQETGRALIEELVRLRASGKTLLAVTHDERLAQSAGRVLVLEEGLLREEG